MGNWTTSLDDNQIVEYIHQSKFLTKTADNDQLHQSKPNERKKDKIFSVLVTEQEVAVDNLSKTAIAFFKLKTGQSKTEWSFGRGRKRNLREKIDFKVQKKLDLELNSSG